MSENVFLAAVLTAALKGTAILAGAAMITMTWRSASAAAKHLVWTIAVALTLALPLIGAAMKRVNAPAIEVTTWTPATVAVQPVVEQKAQDVPLTPLSEEMKAPVEKIELIPPSSPAVPKPSLLIVWLAGVVASMLPFFAALIRIKRVQRSSRKVTDPSWKELIASTRSISHLAGRVEILESDTTAMPMTWGVVRPKLLIPSSASSWPEWEKRNVLLHELAHVERHDCLTQLIAQIACSVYWFNPLSWLAAHRMRVERELACDDRVIAAGSKASDYAANLLNVAKSLRAPRFTSQTAIAMARPSQLSGRLLAVLDSGRNRRSVTRRIAFASSVIALAFVLPLAALTPRAEAAPAGIAPDAIISAVQLATDRPVPKHGTDLVAYSDTPAPVTTAIAQGTSCWADRDGKTGVSIQSNDDSHNGRDSYTIKYSRDNCSLEIRADGKFTLRPDLSDVESMSSDGWIRIEERVGRSTRRMEIRRNGGGMDHQYWVNGDRAPYDDTARAWLASTLLSVERRTAFGAETRVPALYRQGGINAVLNEISQMYSEYPKAKYYDTLLDMGVKLDASALNTIVRRASSELIGSDYYLSEVLGRFGDQPAANETTWQTFAEVAGRMKSDYYRSEILKKVLTKGRLSSQTVGTLLESASGMKSDYYLTDLLKTVARQYALNASTRQYYADALRHIESDYYRADLLGSLDGGDWDARTSSYVLASVADIKSDYYRSESLAKLVRDDHVSDWNAFFNATAGIQSDYYKKSALVAALQRKPLTRDIVAGVLNVVPRMRSDNDMADVLQVVSREYKIDDSLRPAFDRAVDAIRSDYYRGSAISALRRN